MSDCKHLNKSPIIEANIEIRCDIKDIVDKLKDIFIEKFSLKFSELKVQNISFNPLKGDLSVPAPTMMGFEARTDTDVIQIRNDGLLFSRIKDYNSFDDINKYIETFSKSNLISSISRIGCRYINLFSIDENVFPNKFYNLSIYEKDLSIKQQIFKREVSQIDNFNIILINNIARNYDNMLNVTFDIDVSTSEENNIKQLNDTIVKIRKLKNDIFFNYIHEYEGVFS